MHRADGLTRGMNAAQHAADDATCVAGVLWDERGVNILFVLLLVLAVFMLAYMLKYIKGKVKKQQMLMQRMLREEGSKEGKLLSPCTNIRIKWWPVKVSRLKPDFKSWKDYQINAQLTENFLRQHYPSSTMSWQRVAAIADSGFFLWEEDEMVGCVFVRTDEQVFLDENINRWLVYCLCIHKNYRGQHLATKLMQQLIHYAKVHGIEQMQLWVDVDYDEMIAKFTQQMRFGQLSWKTAMYEKLGFEGVCGEQVADNEYVVMMRATLS